MAFLLLHFHLLLNVQQAFLPDRWRRLSLFDSAPVAEYVHVWKSTRPAHILPQKETKRSWSTYISQTKSYLICCSSQHLPNSKHLPIKKHSTLPQITQFPQSCGHSKTAKLHTCKMFCRLIKPQALFYFLSLHASKLHLSIFNLFRQLITIHVLLLTCLQERETKSLLLADYNFITHVIHITPMAWDLHGNQL